MAEKDSQSAVERWVSFGATIIAPATLLSALLFYYGYVSSRAQYQYFGIDVDTTGLGTQDYIMRSPQALLVPLLGLTLVGGVLLLAHSRIRSLLANRWWFAVACVVLAAGVVQLGLYGVIGEWWLYNLLTPLVIAVGAMLTAYTWRPLPGRKEARTVIGLLCAVIFAGVFWATATVAQWSGRGVAQYEARHLDRLPSVILDTRERLFLRSPGIEETALAESAGQTFHYRYRHLRLLIVGRDRMFLVPDKWSASDSTLIVPVGDSARVQFQFQNDPP